jgi:hypothetical protein
VIHIAKDGFKRLEWDGDLQKDVEREFESILCLREGVTQIEAGVTLGDIITFTYQDEFLRGFIGCYSGCNVGAFYDELQGGVDPIDPGGKMQYCTVAMETEVLESKKYKIEKKLEVGLDFLGRGEGGEKWGLDLSPLKEFAALPFRLEANARVQHSLDGSFEVEDGLQYTPSLLEILDAIFFDISFHGSPKARDARRLEVLKAARAVEDGTATLVPLNFEDDQEAEA